MLKHVLQYLKSTQHRGIIYKANQKQPSLISYSDADFAGLTSGRKSITGQVYTFNNSPVSWNPTKQGIQALSTCEAEYIPATSTFQTIQWFRRILDYLKTLGGPIPLNLDNQAATRVASKPAGTKRRKFIDIRRHFLREHLTQGHITLKHFPSASMLADILTKPLRKQLFLKIRQALNIIQDFTLPQSCARLVLHEACHQGSNFCGTRRTCTENTHTHKHTKF